MAISFFSLKGQIRVGVFFCCFWRLLKTGCSAGVACIAGPAGSSVRANVFRKES